MQTFTIMAMHVFRGARSVFAQCVNSSVNMKRCHNIEEYLSTYVFLSATNPYSLEPCDTLQLLLMVCSQLVDHILISSSSIS